MADGSFSEFSLICGELGKVLIEVQEIKIGVNRLLKLHEPATPLHPEPITQEKPNAPWYDGRSCTDSEDVGRWKSAALDEQKSSSSADVSTQSPVEWDSPPRLYGEGEEDVGGICFTATTTIPATPTTPLATADISSIPFSIPDSADSSLNNSTVTTTDHTPETLADVLGPQLTPIVNTGGGESGAIAISPAGVAVKTTRKKKGKSSGTDDSAEHLPPLPGSTQTGTSGRKQRKSTAAKTMR